MTDANIDPILEELVQVMPVFHRKLLRMDLGGVTGDLTRLHLFVMKVLDQGAVTASDVAKASGMSRPQVTHLVDQLVERGIVERRPDTEDRRVINLALTAHGRAALEDVHRKVREHVRQKLSCLTPEELARVLVALRTLRDIGARL